jgi:hypothetical protein
MSGVGYWGVPGTCRTTVVHIKRDWHSALCGQTFGPKFEYQFCSAVVDDFSLRHVECDACKRRYASYLRAMARIPKRTKRIIAMLARRETKHGTG